jgi:hypothetical protein
MSDSNQVNRVALVGASGHIGQHIAEELVKKNIQVTALTRPDSTSTFPSTLTVAKVSNDDHAGLVKALTGQDVLIVTLGVTAPQDTQPKLIRAAAEAGVKYIIPNEWGPDGSHAGMARDMFFTDRVEPARLLIQELGKSSWIVISTGFWYEWSLSIPNAFGFDFPNKTVTFFDEGNAKMNVSSWPQVGRAVAGLLSLPIKSDGKEPSLEGFKGKWVYPTSFCISQRDILASVLRVTGDKESDWTIKKEPSKERYENAAVAVRRGEYAQFVVAMYTRGFFPNEDANVERHQGGNNNKELGLQEENLDEYTKIAMDRVEHQAKWFKANEGKVHVNANQ